MRYRHLLLATGLLCTSAAAQTIAPPTGQPSDRWSATQPATAATASGVYRDALSAAATDAERFHFNDQAPKDKYPADQSPIRVIINNGRGPHVNCVPMGVSGACH